MESIIEYLSTIYRCSEMRAKDLVERHKDKMNLNFSDAHNAEIIAEIEGLEERDDD